MSGRGGGAPAPPPRRPVRALAAAWASALALALASCVIDVALGVGPGAVASGEICGDQIDNDGDRLVDEGCGVGKDCRLPMDARAVGDCDQPLGFAWNGQSCVELRGCACLGSRCGALYDTGPGCELDKRLCISPDDDLELCGDRVDNDGDQLIDEDCPTPCPAVAQDLAGTLDPSCPDAKVLGYAWDGRACVELKGCRCDGPACDALDPDLDSCLEKTRQCLPAECQSPVEPPQPDGDGSGQTPIIYESFDPAECARLGPFPCGPGFEFFSNECGCGCVGRPPPDPSLPFSILLHASYDPAECQQRKVTCANTLPQVSDFIDSSGCGCLYKSECPDLSAPGVELNSSDPRACVELDFACKAPEQVAFRGPCGCGCMPAPPELCSMPAQAYALADPYLCAIKPIDCPPDQRPFRDFCGCGCAPLAAPTDCPDPEAPGVDYLDATPENFAICGLLSYQCGPDQVPFSLPACGCGCRPLDGEPPPPPNPAPLPAPGP
ncbi:MAG TPA: hypothetical protein VFS43_13030 [Polyangiaceae bacterium]|nr:hypothetical protein [Polyangiaceae bacterium]